MTRSMVHQADNAFLFPCIFIFFCSISYIYISSLKIIYYREFEHSILLVEVNYLHCNVEIKIRSYVSYLQFLCPIANLKSTPFVHG